MWFIGLRVEKTGEFICDVLAYSYLCACNAVWIYQELLFLPEEKGFDVVCFFDAFHGVWHGEKSH